MRNDHFARVARRLLEIKAKATANTPWSKLDQSEIDQALQCDNPVRALAACCILASERPKNCPKSLAIIRNVMRGQALPPYVELCIYEALTHVDGCLLATHAEQILPFVENSLERRTVNIDNTVFMLGALGRSGESRSLRLLRQLARDADNGVRTNASLVLKGIV
jgi:hypothetical protein